MERLENCCTSVPFSSIIAVVVYNIIKQSRVPEVLLHMPAWSIQNMGDVLPAGKTVAIKGLSGRQVVSTRTITDAAIAVHSGLLKTL